MNKCKSRILFGIACPECYSSCGVFLLVPLSGTWPSIQKPCGALASTKLSCSYIRLTITFASEQPDHDISSFANSSSKIDLLIDNGISLCQNPNRSSITLENRSSVWTLLIQPILIKKITCLKVWDSMEKQNVSWLLPMWTVIRITPIFTRWLSVSIARKFTADCLQAFLSTKMIVSISYWKRANILWSRHSTDC